MKKLLLVIVFGLLFISCDRSDELIIEKTAFEQFKERLESKGIILNLIEEGMVGEETFTRQKTVFCYGYTIGGSLFVNIFSSGGINYIYVTDLNGGYTLNELNVSPEQICEEAML